jgi:hypothetical protein
MIKDPKLLLGKMKELSRQVTALKAELGAVGLFKSMHKLHEVELEIELEIQEKTHDLG